MDDRVRADRRRPDRRADGAVRIGPDSRPRHPGSHRSDPDQRQPRRAEGRGTQTNLRHQHRVGRTVRRGRTDHPDRRRDRIADRAALSSDERREEDAARRRSGSRDVGDIRRSGRIGAPRGRAAAVRVEAAQHGAGRTGERHRRRGTPLHSRPRADLPRAGASDLHRPSRTRWLRRVRPARGRAVSLADRSGLHSGGRVSEAPDPLDVVAGDRRPRDRAGRSDLPAGARRRL